MGPIWDRQDPGGPHVVPMNFVIWEGLRNCHLTMEDMCKRISSWPGDLYNAGIAIKRIITFTLLGLYYIQRSLVHLRVCISGYMFLVGYGVMIFQSQVYSITNTHCIVKNHPLSWVACLYSARKNHSVSQTRVPFPCGLPPFDTEYITSLRTQFCCQ